MSERVWRMLLKSWYMCACEHRDGRRRVIVTLWLRSNILCLLNVDEMMRLNENDRQSERDVAVKINENNLTNFNRELR